jgi:hypothetical protein
MLSHALTILTFDYCFKQEMKASVLSDALISIYKTSRIHLYDIITSIRRYFMLDQTMIANSLGPLLFLYEHQIIIFRIKKNTLKSIKQARLINNGSGN